MDEKEYSSKAQLCIGRYLDNETQKALDEVAEIFGQTPEKIASLIVRKWIEDPPRREDWIEIVPEEAYDVLTELRDRDGVLSLEEAEKSIETIEEIPEDVLDWLSSKGLVRGIEEGEISFTARGRRIARALDDLP